MSSLDELYGNLFRIDKDYSDSSRLLDVSFGVTQNKSLGFKDDTTDFIVSQPWGAWPENEQSLKRTDPAKGNINAANFPSPLQAAFKDVLVHGKSSEECFIDIVTMDIPGGNFFLQGRTSSGDQSVAKAIADTIEAVRHPKAKITVRFLSGSNAPHDFSKFKDVIEGIFWPDTGTGTDRKPLVTGKINATLHLGFYSPTFDLGKHHEPIEMLRKKIGSIEAVAAKLKEKFKRPMPALDQAINFLKGSDTDIIKKVGDQLQASSWNHGKLLVVNGKTLMTGGANYWWQSAAGIYDIIEEQAKVEGDAAVAAHKWCDYFFSYLNKRHVTDTTSWRKSVNLNQAYPPDWTKFTDTVPLSQPKSKTPDGKYKILTTSQLGDWHTREDNFDYPVQAVQALKDLLLNIIWQYLYSDDYLKSRSDLFKGALKSQPVQGIVTILISALFTENQDSRAHLSKALDKPLPDPYKLLNVNPTAWASRMTRLSAIANAKKSVIICQQKLILSPIQTKFDHLKKINEQLTKLGGKSTWDGCTWPFDLLIAIGYALARTRGTANGSANIQIVLSVAEKDAAEGPQPGWDDAMLINDFKGRLRMIMSAMAMLDNFAEDDSSWQRLLIGAAGSQNVPLTPGQIKEVDQAAHVFPAVEPIPQGEIEKAIDERIAVRRTLRKDKEKGAIYEKKEAIYNHSKVVVVDDHLMYVGSDNIYPAYLEEHGIWVDDQQAITKWKESFFKGLWDRSYVA